MPVTDAYYLQTPYRLRIMWALMRLKSADVQQNKMALGPRGVEMLNAAVQALEDILKA